MRPSANLRRHSSLSFSRLCFPRISLCPLRLLSGSSSPGSSPTFFAAFPVHPAASLPASSSLSSSISSSISSSPRRSSSPFSSASFPSSSSTPSPSFPCASSLGFTASVSPISACLRRRRGGSRPFRRPLHVEKREKAGRRLSPLFSRDSRRETGRRNGEAAEELQKSTAGATPFVGRTARDRRGRDLFSPHVDAGSSTQRRVFSSLQSARPGLRRTNSPAQASGQERDQCHSERGSDGYPRGKKTERCESRGERGGETQSPKRHPRAREDVDPVREEASRVLKNLLSVTPAEWLHALEALSRVVGEMRGQRGARRKRDSQIRLQMLMETAETLRRQVRAREKQKKQARAERRKEKEARDQEERLNHGRPVWKKRGGRGVQTPEGEACMHRSSTSVSFGVDSSASVCGVPVLSPPSSLRLRGGLPLEALLWRYPRYLPHLTLKQLVRLLVVVERLDFHDGRSPPFVAFLPFPPSCTPYSFLPAFLASSVSPSRPMSVSPDSSLAGDSSVASESLPEFRSSVEALQFDLRSVLLGAFLYRLSRPDCVLSLEEVSLVARFFARERLPDPAVPFTFFSSERSRAMRHCPRSCGDALHAYGGAAELRPGGHRPSSSAGHREAGRGQSEQVSEGELEAGEFRLDERLSHEAAKKKDDAGKIENRQEVEARKDQEFMRWVTTSEGKPLVVRTEICMLFELLLKAAQAAVTRSLARREKDHERTETMSKVDGGHQPPSRIKRSNSSSSPPSLASSPSSCFSCSASSSSSSLSLPSSSSVASRTTCLPPIHETRVLPLLEACGKLQFVSLRRLYSPLLSWISPALMVSRSLLSLSKTLHLCARLDLSPASHPDFVLPLLRRTASPAFFDLLHSERSAATAQVAVGELALATVSLESGCEARRSPALFAEIKLLQEETLFNCLRAVTLYTQWEKLGKTEDRELERFVPCSPRSSSSSFSLSGVSPSARCPSEEARLSACSSSFGLRDSADQDGVASSELETGEKGGSQTSRERETSGVFARGRLGQPSPFLCRQIETAALAIGFEFPLLVAKLQQLQREDAEQEEQKRGEATGRAPESDAREETRGRHSEQQGDLDTQHRAEQDTVQDTQHGEEHVEESFSASVSAGLSGSPASLEPPLTPTCSSPAQSLSSDRSSPSASAPPASPRAVAADSARSCGGWSPEGDGRRSILQMLKYLSLHRSTEDALEVQKESSAQHSQVSSALRALGIRHQVEYPAGPYLLDVALEEEAICIEIEGPLHFTDVLQRPREEGTPAKKTGRTVDELGGRARGSPEKKDSEDTEAWRDTTSERESQAGAGRHEQTEVFREREDEEDARSQRRAAREEQTEGREEREDERREREGEVLEEDRHDTGEGSERDERKTMSGREGSDREERVGEISLDNAGVPQLSTLHYDSKTRLKHRILTGAGWHVLHIAWFDWPRRPHNQQAALIQLLRKNSPNSQRDASEDDEREEEERREEKDTRHAGVKERCDSEVWAVTRETNAEARGMEALREKSHPAQREAPKSGGKARQEAREFRVYRRQFSDLLYTEQDTVLSVEERLRDEEKDFATWVSPDLSIELPAPDQVPIFPEDRCWGDS
ncbi:RAP domain-containing protein [Toxoplasma gondii GT1]|uniref:RAP domain-containing protein n=5 Tax=Toxoplasma gondii TaxID=5811 RepID=S7V2N7_TOXGG|nr:RAP domain-containing protein [Toxoplasma gondii GT1]KAF4641811.1 RAP domain-containing protein [Toxoplasma gondii]KFG55336.1 RAP domain-containing protein [Toxoplasma gondii FOU]PUA92689.1 RAP domain-containing protein [Toxoplasma gondii TgCATBr9]RQX75815.1 RAP domain-containing protein [Toxoplasma gondii CAST]